MIIFDLDGTLINSELFLKKIEFELKCEMGHPIGLDEQISRFGGIGPYQQLELDPSLPMEFARLAEERFRSRAESELMPCPGVIDFLQSYEGDKLIASNGPLEWIVKATEVTKLDQFFSKENFFHVGLVKNKKPAPDLFLLAAQSAKPGDEIVIIEDSLTGVAAGIASKFRTIGCLGTSTNPESLKRNMNNLGVRQTFSDYRELHQIL